MYHMFNFVFSIVICNGFCYFIYIYICVCVCVMICFRTTSSNFVLSLGEQRKGNNYIEGERKDAAQYNHYSAKKSLKNIIFSRVEMNGLVH
jgi:hypothetical protein